MEYIFFNIIYRNQGPNTNLNSAIFKVLTTLISMNLKMLKTFGTFSQLEVRQTLAI